MVASEKGFPFELRLALNGAPKARRLWGLDVLEAQGMVVELPTLEMTAALYLRVNYPTKRDEGTLAPLRVVGWAPRTAVRVASWLEEGGYVGVVGHMNDAPITRLTARGAELLAATGPGEGGTS